jgi:hypothetical protein
MDKESLQPKGADAIILPRAIAPKQYFVDTVENIMSSSNSCEVSFPLQER